MSKLYSIYLSEKNKNEDTIILFKSGIFYLALGQDATYLSNTFGFKLTNLNNDIKKCGFPCSSLDKYMRLFNACNLSVSIIDPDKDINYKLEDYKVNKCTLELLDLIKNIDVNNLSISQAYEFIEELKQKANNINLL